MWNPFDPFNQFSTCHKKLQFSPFHDAWFFLCYLNLHWHDEDGLMFNVCVMANLIFTYIQSISAITKSI